MIDYRTPRFLLLLTLCLSSCGLMISSPLLAGSLYLTGHDVLLHGGQNGYAKVILDCLRGAGTSDEIPAASYDIALLRSPLGGAIVPMGFGTVTVFDPSAIASNDAAWADVFSHDVVVVASHVSCSGCAIDDEDVTAMVARRAEFVKFFNAGGDIWANSGANSAEYYDFLPPALLSTASAISGSTGFSATPEGVAIGITASMINGFPTHNRFVDFSPALTIFEVRGEEVISLGIHGGEFNENGELIPPEDCLERRRETLLCTTDGSGDFLYRLLFFNRSDDVVHHLFLVDPSGKLTFEPNHIELDPPVQPGHARSLFSQPIRIQGAQPGETVTFFITLHDELIDECCAVEVTLELPECDCGQVLAGRAPSCFAGIFGGGRRIDRFTFQNLFPADEVDHILLTVDSPDNVELQPNVFHLKPPSKFADTDELTVRIQGGRPGDEVCYRISTHDELFDDCCSIQRCVRLPDCRIDPTDIKNFDGTTKRFVDDGLVIEGFPPVGEPPGGVVIDAQDAVSWDGAWLPVEAADLPTDTVFQKTFSATVDGEEAQPVVVLESRKTSEGIELRGRYPALDVVTQTVELYRRGILLERIENMPVEEPLRPIFNAEPQRFEMDAHYTLLGATPITQSGGTACDPLEQTRCLFAGYTFRERFPISLFSLAEVDEIRLIPEHVENAIGPLTEVRLEGAGLEALVVESLFLDFDCNSNGFLDFNDIALRNSFDANRNGVPDECEVDTLNLNTGFDESVGALLPPGAEDDDWRVVQTGQPARVVRNPISNWAEPLPDSAWISIEPERGASPPGLPLYELERCFCLAGTDGEVELELELFVDDRASVRLNGELLERPGGSFRGPDPFGIRMAGTVDDGLFQAGENCLVVEVDDFGGIFTGLDLTGAIQAEDGFCIDISR